MNEFWSKTEIWGKKMKFGVKLGLGLKKINFGVVKNNVPSIYHLNFNFILFLYE